MDKKVYWVVGLVAVVVVGFFVFGNFPAEDTAGRLNGVTSTDVKSSHSFSDGSNVEIVGREEVDNTEKYGDMRGEEETAYDAETDCSQFQKPDCLDPPSLCAVQYDNCMNYDDTDSVGGGESGDNNVQVQTE